MDKLPPYESLKDPEKEVARNALIEAAGMGYADQFRELLLSGVPMEEVRSGTLKYTIFHLLAMQQSDAHGEMREFAFETAEKQGLLPDIINVGNDIGSTPLHYAAYRRNMDAASDYLAHGALVNIRSLNEMDGKTSVSPLDVVNEMIEYNSANYHPDDDNAEELLALNDRLQELAGAMEKQLQHEVANNITNKDNRFEQFWSDKIDREPPESEDREIS